MKMAEYIEREAVMKAAKNGNHSDFGRSMADLTSLREVLEDIPSADVVEVRHGEWKAKLVLNISTNPYIGDEYYHQCAVCSECGCKVDEVIQKKLKALNYCPNCGAKMDGKAGKSNA